MHLASTTPGGLATSVARSHQISATLEIKQPQLRRALYPGPLRPQLELRVLAARATPPGSGSGSGSGKAQNKAHGKNSSSSKASEAQHKPQAPKQQQPTPFGSSHSKSAADAAAEATLAQSIANAAAAFRNAPRPQLHTPPPTPTGMPPQLGPLAAAAAREEALEELAEAEAAEERSTANASAGVLKAAAAREEALSSLAEAEDENEKVVAMAAAAGAKSTMQREPEPLQPRKAVPAGAGAGAGAATAAAGSGSNMARLRDAEEIKAGLKRGIKEGIKQGLRLSLFDIIRQEAHQVQEAVHQQQVAEHGEEQVAAAGRSDKQLLRTAPPQQQQYVPQPPTGMSGTHGSDPAASLSDEDRLFPTAPATATGATTTTMPKTAPPMPTTASGAAVTLPSATTSTQQAGQQQKQKAPTAPGWKSIDELRTHRHDFACGPSADEDAPCATGGVVVVAMDDSDDAAAAAAFAAQHVYNPGVDELRVVHVVCDPRALHWTTSVGATPSGRDISLDSMDLTELTDVGVMGGGGVRLVAPGATAAEVAEAAGVPAAGGDSNLQDYLSRLSSSAAAVVSRRCAGLAAAGVTHYSTELPRLTVPRSAAAIAQALMEAVKRADAKLLVVANHGPGALAEFGSVARYCYQHSAVPLLLFPSLAAQAEAAALAARHLPAAAAAAAATAAQAADAVATEDAEAPAQPYVPRLDASVKTAAGGAAAADAAITTPDSSDAEYMYQPDQLGMTQQPARQPAEARARSVAAAAAGAAVSRASAAASAVAAALLEMGRQGRQADPRRVEVVVLEREVEAAVEDALAEGEVEAELEQLVEAAMQGDDVATALDEAVTDAVQEAVTAAVMASTTTPAAAGVTQSDRPASDRPATMMPPMTDEPARLRQQQQQRQAQRQAQGPDVLLVVNHLEELAEVWQWVADNVTKKGDTLAIWHVAGPSASGMPSLPVAIANQLRRRGLADVSYKQLYSASGDPADLGEQVCTAAALSPATRLVVMLNYSRRGLIAEALRGSLASHLSRHCAKPLLLLQLPE
ncbi:hypothetical protein HYH02_007499 [Chlamydomonas schloesseri]|uniref:UspA domain-containing protein n=1 Tax=Chlamydomonas schloesseri TaxID=2026947 RepID=A0A836B4M6_9CHLO|nr:hypothetical protein HYH02_007499 [Chlamydomonas schloesseri]|eukprot:KAG2447576.1 hypothetical protein HYH02_007499 [Chlamydomonas schloesseri]